MHNILPSLQAKHITKTYCIDDVTQCILKNFNFTFHAGSVYGISGASGCGKSTLLALLAGCEIPTSGTVIYSDGSATFSPSQCRMHHTLSYIPQAIVLVPELSVYENLQCKLLLAGITDSNQTKKMITQWAKKCTIDALLSHYPAMLSGGQRQRVAFAQATIIVPKFLLIDEVTANLDTENAMKCIRLCQSLAVDHGVGVLLASHDISLLAQCDTIITNNTFIIS